MGIYSDGKHMHLLMENDYFKAGYPEPVLYLWDMIYNLDNHLYYINMFPTAMASPVMFSNIFRGKYVNDVQTLWFGGITN